MTSTQTTSTTQNSSQSSDPFAQIQELELREKARTEKEFAALAKEKEEVTQAIAKKEEQAADELKVEAKKELKKHSETELSTILMDAKKESSSETDALQAKYKEREADAVKTLVSKASDADTLFSTAA